MRPRNPRFWPQNGCQQNGPNKNINRSTKKGSPAFSSLGTRPGTTSLPHVAPCANWTLSVYVRPDSAPSLAGPPVFSRGLGPCPEQLRFLMRSLVLDHAPQVYPPPSSTGELTYYRVLQINAMGLPKLEVRVPGCVAPCVNCRGFGSVGHV